MNGNQIRYIHENQCLKKCLFSKEYEEGGEEINAQALIELVSPMMEQTVLSFDTAQKREGNWWNIHPCVWVYLCVSITVSRKRSIT